MLVWVASQSVLVIALIAFAWSYAMAAAIGALVGLFAQRGHAADLKAISPVTLTPLAVVFGLFVGFLAAEVWPNFERARNHVADEAIGLRQAVILTEAMPAETRDLVRRAVRDHIAIAVKEEWPAMAAGSASLGQWSHPLSTAIADLLAMNPANPGQEIARQHALSALERAVDARRQRIVLSETSVGGIKWFVFMMLAGLIEVTIAMVHVDNRQARRITLFIFATAVAVSTLVIMAYDHPYGGGVLVTPRLLQEVIPD
jgi:uncharacterized protein DUF4239